MSVSQFVKRTVNTGFLTTLLTASSFFGIACGGGGSSSGGGSTPVNPTPKEAQAWTTASAVTSNPTFNPVDFPNGLAPASDMLGSTGVYAEHPVITPLDLTERTVVVVDGYGVTAVPNDPGMPDTDINKKNIIVAVMNITPTSADIQAQTENAPFLQGELENNYDKLDGARTDALDRMQGGTPPQAPMKVEQLMITWNAQTQGWEFKPGSYKELTSDQEIVGKATHELLRQEQYAALPVLGGDYRIQSRIYPSTHHGEFMQHFYPQRYGKDINRYRFLVPMGKVSLRGILRPDGHAGAFIIIDARHPDPAQITISTRRLSVAVDPSADNYYDAIQGFSADMPDLRAVVKRGASIPAAEVLVDRKVSSAGDILDAEIVSIAGGRSISNENDVHRIALDYMATIHTAGAAAVGIGTSPVNAALIQYWAKPFAQETSASKAAESVGTQELTTGDRARAAR